jgi:hypothetical protein
MKTLTIMLRSAQENEALLIKECDFAKNRLSETEMELKEIKLEKEEMEEALEKFQVTTKSLFSSLDQFSKEASAANGRVLELEELLASSEHRVDELCNSHDVSSCIQRENGKIALIQHRARNHKVTLSVEQHLVKCCLDTWMYCGLRRKRLALVSWKIVRKYSLRLQRYAFCNWIRCKDFKTSSHTSLNLIMKKARLGCLRMGWMALETNVISYPSNFDPNAALLINSKIHSSNAMEILLENSMICWKLKIEHNNCKVLFFRRKKANDIRLKYCTLNSWLDSVSEKRKHILFFEQRLRYKRMHFFHLWLACFRVLLINKNILSTLMKKSSTERRKKELSVFFSLWDDRILALKKHRRGVNLVRSSLTRRLQSKIFRIWMDTFTFGKNLHRLRGRMSQSIKKRCLLRHAKNWSEFLRVQKGILAFTAMVSVRQKKSLRCKIMKAWTVFWRREESLISTCRLMQNKVRRNVFTKLSRALTKHQYYAKGTESAFRSMICKRLFEIVKNSLTAWIHATYERKRKRYIISRTRTWMFRSRIHRS